MIVHSVDKDPYEIILDEAGYFVISVDKEEGLIRAKHYNYDKILIRTIEGRDARNIYWTILDNEWVSMLSHAAYLGKELTKAELSLTYDFDYEQN